MRDLAIFMVLVVTICLNSACNKTDSFGSELVEDDQLKVSSLYYNNFNIGTEQVDNLLMYIRDSTMWDFFAIEDNFLLGEVSQNAFGNTKAEMYLQFINASRRTFENADRLVVDSVVLSIAFDSTFDVYGFESSTFDVNVHELVEDMNADRYYTSSEIMFDQTPIGQLTSFSPDPKKPFQVIDEDSDTSNLFPQMQIRLSNSFGQTFIGLDTLVQDDEDDFLQFFKGLHIEMNRTSGDGSLTRYHIAHSSTRVRIFYHNMDSTDDNQVYILTPYAPEVTSGGVLAFGQRFAHFNAVNHSLDSASQDADLIYYQNLGASFVTLDVNIDETFDTINLLNAYLELTVDRSSYDTTNFGEVVSLVPTYRDSDPDFFQATGDYTGLGRQPAETRVQATTLEENPFIYRIELTKYILDLIRDPANNRIIYIRDPLLRRTPYGSVFYGKQNETFPARIQLVYNSSRN